MSPYVVDAMGPAEFWSYMRSKKSLRYDERAVAYVVSLAQRSGVAEAAGRCGVPRATVARWAAEVGAGARIVPVREGNPRGRPRTRASDAEKIGAAFAERWIAGETLAAVAAEEGTTAGRVRRLACVARPDAPAIVRALGRKRKGAAAPSPAMPQAREEAEGPGAVAARPAAAEAPAPPLAPEGGADGGAAAEAPEEEAPGGPAAAPACEPSGAADEERRVLAPIVPILDDKPVNSPMPFERTRSHLEAYQQYPVPDPPPTKASTAEARCRSCGAVIVVSVPEGASEQQRALLVHKAVGEHLHSSAACF